LRLGARDERSRGEALTDLANVAACAPGPQ